MTQLVILDVDGLLVQKYYRPKTSFEKIQELENDPQVFTVKDFLVKPREGLSDFFEKLFSEYVVGIWTSSMYSSVDPILSQILTSSQRESLLFVWCRDKTELDPDYYPGHPTLKEHSTVKKLERILSHPLVNSQRKWTWDNLLLIEDSSEKVRLNPPQNYLVWPDFHRSLQDIFEEEFFQPSSPQNQDSLEEKVQALSLS